MFRKLSEYKSVKKIGQNKSKPAAATSKTNNKPFETHKLPKGDDKNSIRNAKIWIAKPVPSNMIAYCEVIGQELTRLLAPELEQPKTRLCEIDGKLGVLSEKKIDFVSLNDSLGEDNKNAESVGIPTGFGLSIFISWLLRDKDLKLDHINTGLATHIDSDQVLTIVSEPSAHKTNTILEEEISALPYLYVPPGGLEKSPNSPFNWLDQIQGGVVNKSSLIFKDASAAAEFRHDINQGILRFLTLPKELLIDLVKNIVLEEEMHPIFINTFLSLKEELKKAALQNTSFKEYILAETSAKKEISRTDVAHYSNSLLDFQLSSKTPILSGENFSATQIEMLKVRQELQTLARVPALSPAVSSPKKAGRKSSK